ncbi:MAG: Mitochondrial fission protein [Alyxoria varia]|nr:MAG: Mitochondrial fission protein [Alyxoria varia]
MSESRGRNAHARVSSTDDEAVIPTRSLETFGRKVTATAGHLMGDSMMTQHYQTAMGEIHRELRHPLLQRKVFALSQTSPRDLVRSKLSTQEIQHRALTYLPDELFKNMPESSTPFSLFQGFQATLPESDKRRRKHMRRSSRAQRMLEETADDPNAPPVLKKLRNEKQGLDHRLEMMDVRKNLCSTEIREIDTKIQNLNTMRKVVLERLEDLEQEEADMEQEMLEVEGRIEDIQEEADDEAALSGQKTPTHSSAVGHSDDADHEDPDSPGMQASFMSESIYGKLPSPKSKRPKPGRRKTNFILHEHLQAGSKIRELQAHNDTISALDFDVPFGTMVTSALDDTVRVWDLNAGRCMGMLEGHLSSVRCLQVEDNLVATGSMDATVRLWDLNQADYIPPPANNRLNKNAEQELQSSPAESDHENEFTDAPENATPPPPTSSMQDCALHTLSAHVAEITALHFHNNTLVSGSADKTLRQWDLEKGRCVQTLDVLWAAAQASTVSNPYYSGPSTGTGTNSTFGRQGHAERAPPDANADFVGAVQCFDAALACGTADGLVRLWDLRSGQVHRSLIGHTGPVTCLQFDDMHLVTGSADRSVRIWDLRTGSISDAYAYDHPVTSVMFDAKSIVAAAGEDVVKVYDKTDGRHWDCAGDIEAESQRGTVEQVRLKDGFMVEGRKDGIVGAWSV